MGVAVCNAMADGSVSSSSQARCRRGKAPARHGGRPVCGGGAEARCRMAVDCSPGTRTPDARASGRRSMARSPRTRGRAYQDWQTEQSRARSGVSPRTSRGPPPSSGRWPPGLGNALARDADVARAGRRRTSCTEAHSFWVMTAFQDEHKCCTRPYKYHSINYCHTDF